LVYKLKVAAATLNQTPLDWKGNHSRIIQAIRMAGDESVDILCLPELCITGYGCEDLFLSSWVSEKAVSQLIPIAEECRNITVIVGLPIWHGNQNYNCACIIHNKNILGIYAKQFLANDGVHYEPRWFTPWPAGKLEEHGINGINVPFGDFQFSIGEIKCGLEICEDAWRPNRPACRLLEKGVKLILNPSASHFAIGKSTRRKHLVTDSSKTFHCAYVYANLLGNESGRMIYDGELLIAHEGRLIQQNVNLSFREVNLITAEINFNNPSASSASFNFDNADRNDEFLRATTLALFDYLRKSRNQGFVLSLSGGADSSTVAILVAEMVRRGISELGLLEFLNRIRKPELAGLAEGLDQGSVFRKITGELFTCAYQASENSSAETRESARALATSIGATFHEWTIDDEVNSYTRTIEKVIGRKLTWEKDDIALQNIQARVRSPIIWMLANIRGAILLTTSNRSEGDVGYATMDGDTSGSLAPVAGIDKYFILKWLPWAEKHLGYEALNYVNNLTPTAELRPKERSQTDESDLMPYKILLEIEKLAIYCHLSPTAVFLQLKDKNLTDKEELKRYIIKFYQLWARNQWKRERLAPAFHLDDYNVDPRTWCRFPILSGGYEEELEELKNLS
jgi:NAD+ synthase (glutamine-hydrolysing)